MSLESATTLSTQAVNAGESVSESGSRCMLGRRSKLPEWTVVLLESVMEEAAALMLDDVTEIHQTP